MHRLCTRAIATIILLGAGAVATIANAEQNYGPTKNGEQCFTKSGGGSESTFGWWGPCPQPAAAEIQRQPTARAEVQRRPTIRHENRARR